MIRKLAFPVLLTLLAVFMCGQEQKVEAAQWYVGTYSDGTDAYLLTDSVYIISRHPYTFRCTVLYGDYNYLDYSFFPSNGSPYYRNSEGYEGYVFAGQSPVAEHIYRTVVRNR